MLVEVSLAALTWTQLSMWLSWWFWPSVVITKGRMTRWGWTCLGPPQVLNWVPVESSLLILFLVPPVKQEKQQGLCCCGWASSRHAYSPEPSLKSLLRELKNQHNIQASAQGLSGLFVYIIASHSSQSLLMKVRRWAYTRLKDLFGLLLMSYHGFSATLLNKLDNTCKLRDILWLLGPVREKSRCFIFGGRQTQLLHKG